MESNDSYPVFHTRLARTRRRRLLKPDGSSAGWLITTSSEDLVAPIRDEDDPPQLAIPSQR